MQFIRELSNSYEMSKLAIDSMVDHAVYILNTNGIILSSNSGAENLMGFRNNEIFQTHFARFYSMVDIENKYPEHDLQQALTYGRIEQEGWRVRKDGKVFWASIVISKLTDLKGSHIGFSVVTRDLTKKKDREDALKQSQSMALRALKLKSQFIADISHEIRTPLGAILGFAEFLQKDDISTEDRNRYLDIILKNGKNLHRLINDVLDLSKIEAGRIDIQMREFNLDQLINEVIELFHAECAKKKISISYEKNDLDLKGLTSDPNRLQQILVNLVGNAVKFTDNGGIKISVLKSHNKNQYRILINDSGMGMSADESARIFHPYVQADKCHSRAIKGTGLGLILSRKIAEALGGDVELVHSELAIGSTFGINFTDYMTFKSPAKPKMVEPDAKSLTQKNVLIVDDSIDNLEIIKLFLNSFGAEVDLANDGQEALTKISSKQYDVILMDIEMPAMNGFQVIERLKKQKIDTPVIALTAHAMPEDRQKTKNAGFFDHVTKPIDFNYLVAAIENA